MVQGGCDGDTFPLFDGYAGNGNWHAGAGGGALPLLDGGYRGAGFLQSNAGEDIILIFYLFYFCLT